MVQTKLIFQKHCVLHSHNPVTVGTEESALDVLNRSTCSYEPATRVLNACYYISEMLPASHTFHS